MHLARLLMLGGTLLMGGCQPRQAVLAQGQDASSVTPTATWPRAATPPVIDGQVDALWSGVPALPIALPAEGHPTHPADYQASLRVAWDDDALYVLFEVVDDTLVTDSDIGYEDDDSVEFFLDAGYERSPNLDRNDALYLFSMGHETYGFLSLEWGRNGLVFTHGLTAQGYVFEIKVPWFSLRHRPQAGQYMGFAAFVNDDDDGDDRDARYASHFLLNTDTPGPEAFAPVQLVDE